MKNLSLLFILLISLSFTTCDKRDIVEEKSICIEKKINEFDKSNPSEEGINVKKYSFQNKKVYVFNSGNNGADKTSEVIDEYCNCMGYLGGISGNILINGEDFSKAEFESTVWER